MNERTLAILKPDCLDKKVQGKVIQHILDAGFDIKGMRLIRLTEDAAKKFYEVHKERPFYGELVAYMTSGPVILLCLEKELRPPRREWTVPAPAVRRRKQPTETARRGSLDKPMLSEALRKKV